jgi:hypothetical protein
MDAVRRLLEPLAAYPPWFVFTCVALVAIAAVWLLVKAVKGVLYLVLAAVLLILVLAAVAWLLG